MSNLQQAAIDFGYISAFAVAGRQISYVRNSVGICSLSAIVGKTTDEASDEMGLPYSRVTKDYIIKTVDLLVGSSGAEENILPKPGDTIIDAGFTYEVINLTSQSCFYFSDPDKNWIRVHTQEI